MHRNDCLMLNPNNKVLLGSDYQLYHLHRVLNGPLEKSLCSSDIVFMFIIQTAIV